ncbi:She9 / Mdm33 family domain containing protein [Naviculisporaceae sp. PSN 640]
MSPPTALRLAVRPLRSGGRGVNLPFELFLSATFLNRTRLSPGISHRLLSTTTKSSKFNPPICLQCVLSARNRSFSTIPPSSNSPSETASQKDSQQSPESSSQQDEASTTASSDPDARSAEPKPVSESEQPPSSETSTAFENEHPKETPPPNNEPELPSSSEDRRHPLSVRFSTFMDDLQSRVLNATQTINDLTGYSAIEAIKAKNVQLEHDLATAQARLRAARQGYKSLTSHRAATQREVTTLLARKDTWNPTDLERFTNLYRLDHELEAQVASASVELTEAEAEESKLSADLNAGILKRYHEEQIWSDRIRRQSTWGTWGLMGVNILLFLVLQFVAEPWRRRRLMRNIAANEKLVMDDVKRELAEVKAALEASGLREQAKRAEEEAAAKAAEAALAAVHEAAEKMAAEAALEELEGQGRTSTSAATQTDAEAEQTQTQAQPEEHIPWQERWKTTLSDPELIKAALLDLYSERRIDLTMRDASIIALEGAAAGAAVVATVGLILLRGGSSS